MGGPQGHLLSLIACELFEDEGGPPQTTGRDMPRRTGHGA
jgi:hypothetical protein